MPRNRTQATKPASQRLAIEWWPIDRPVPYERNARKIPVTAIDKVAASIRDFSWRQPIIVDAGDTIIAGHTRVLAAKKLGLKQVPVHVAADLSPEQVRGLRIADNRLHQETDWDFALLHLELVDLDQAEFDLALTGFDGDEIERLLSGGELELDPEIDGNQDTNRTGEDFKKITFTAAQYAVIQRWIIDFRSEADDPNMSDGRAIELMLADRASGH